MATETFYPGRNLRPFIQSYTISESAAESAYKVLPQTRVVLGFQFKGTLSYADGDSEIKLARSGITGLRDTYRIFKNSSNIGTVLVNFRDGGASSFFKQPIHDIFGESISLDNLIPRPELARLEELLLEASSHRKKIEALETFLYRQLRDAEPDKLVMKAIDDIHSRNGNIGISDLTDTLNISQSPLEKRFRKVVGTSPKKFASIVRMNHAIRSFKNGQQLTDLAYDAGFYDQAHFIKAFRNFAGQTPESFFRQK